MRRFRVLVFSSANLTIHLRTSPSGILSSGCCDYKMPIVSQFGIICFIVQITLCCLIHLRTGSNVALTCIGGLDNTLPCVSSCIQLLVITKRSQKEVVSFSSSETCSCGSNTLSVLRGTFDCCLCHTSGLYHFVCLC